MADILSTLRELRSLEEKRAHGTLSPEEEQRFQELQATVSSRGPKSGPVTPVPLPQPVPQPVIQTVVQPVSPVVPVPSEEPPFVDADLTEDVIQEATEVRPEPMSAEPTVVQAAPPQVEKPVPMSPAELRQWNASFSPPTAGEPAAQPDVAVQDVAELTQIAVAPSLVPQGMAEIPAPAATDWLAPTPLDASPEAPPATTPAESAVVVPLDAGPEPTIPDPSVEVDDAPAVWSEPTPPLLLPTSSLLDDFDGWSVSVAGTSPGEVAADTDAEPALEPGGLGPASPSMDPTLADAYEPATEVQRSNDSSSGVTSKRMTPIGEAFAAGESRVVVHMLGGVQKRGSLVDAHMNADFLELRLPDGEKEMLSTAALKAVFFVVPIGQDVPKPVGDPVTVTLQDGHQLTGLSPDYQVGAVGFFLSPTDQRSRTAKIYIYAGAVKGIS